MASAANIVLADKTPANHTFEPIQVAPALTIHEEHGVALTPPGQLSFTTGLSLASASRSTDRVTIRFTFPVEQTVDDITSVAYTLRANLDVIIPSQATNAQREHLAAYVQNLMANAVIKDYYLRKPQW